MLLVCFSLGEKPYKKHINRDNPLGMGGALADTYGQLLEEMWSGSASYLAPRQFKVDEQGSFPKSDVCMSVPFHNTCADHDWPPCPAVLWLSAAR